MKRILQTFALLSGLLGSAFAQINTGTILGVVKDHSGAVVPGAKVVITNAATGVSVQFQTAEDGTYVVPYLLPGSYQVSGERAGFKVTVRRGITLEVDQKARVDMILEVGNAAESVSVVGVAPMIQTDSSEMSAVVTSRKNGRTADQYPVPRRVFQYAK